MSNRLYDLVSIGRANLDLFSQDIGAEFEDVRGFDAMVGGSPTNIAIGAARLGLQAIALTAIGEDRVGDLVLKYLQNEGVVTDYIKRKPGKLTSLALLGVQPPSHFPLSFYRDDPADIYLTVADADAVSFRQVDALQVSGNALSRGTCADAARHTFELAKLDGVVTYMDLDLRPTDWAYPKAFGEAIRSVLVRTKVVMGTEEEYYAALMPEPEPVMRGEPIPAGDGAELEDRIAGVLAEGPAAVVVKRGPQGATVLSPGERLDVPGFDVEVVNTVGAGDSFAAGLIRSRLLGWGWYEAARFANACGAIVVTRHGCSVALPKEHEVDEFVAARGGL